MAKITVKARIDGGVHLKHGPIIKGQTYTIDEEDFGAELFERPEGFESPHEKTDRERAEVEQAKSPAPETSAPMINEEQLASTSSSKSAKGGK